MLTHIPLVISGEIEDKVVHKPVSLIDIYSTILEEADIKEHSSRGRSLFDPSVRPLLSRYDGLTPFARSRLRDLGVSEQEIQEWDQPLIGGVGKKGNYIYQSNPSENLSADEATNESSIKEINKEVSVDNDNMDPVTADISAHLKSLGYK